MSKTVYSIKNVEFYDDTSGAGDVYCDSLVVGERYRLSRYLYEMTLYALDQDNIIEEDIDIASGRRIRYLGKSVNGWYEFELLDGNWNAEAEFEYADEWIPLMLSVVPEIV